MSYRPKAYHGERLPETGELVVAVEDETGRKRPLPHVVHHGPDGHEIGYGGSGPADLALSILADLLEERPTRDELYRGRSIALSHHQGFKRRFLEDLPRDVPFSIPADAVAAFLRERGVDPERPSWFRVLLPTHPTARTALAAGLYTTAEGLLDAAENAPNQGAKEALEEAAYELFSSLEGADVTEGDATDGT